ncbi:MAG: DNA replication and repair protein RecF [Gemmatimonadales bacterium]
MLDRLTIRDYRNLASLDVTLPPEGAVVLGANGQGKTNLLEAIYYLVLFRSFRGARDAELVRFGRDGFFIGADVGTHVQRTTCNVQRVTAGYESVGKRKKVTLDGEKPARLADAVGKVTAVLFAPTDRMLVAGPPSERRRWMDVVLSLTARAYLAQLSTYRQALRQRNAALRHGTWEAAWAFDGVLATAGAFLLHARLDWVAAHADRYAELMAALGETGSAAMRYRAHGHVTTDGLAQALSANRDQDRERRATGVGPHRDDLVVMLGGHHLRTYGSAGQQRTAAIALRLLETEALTAARGVPPIGLFDDAFVELDGDRQSRLLGLVRQALPGQAIIAAPRESEVPAAMFDRPRWTMQGGRVHA